MAPGAAIKIFRDNLETRLYILGLNRDSARENGNYTGIMETKMGFTGIMEKKMETIILG